MQTVFHSASSGLCAIRPLHLRSDKLESTNFCCGLKVCVPCRIAIRTCKSKSRPKRYALKLSAAHGSWQLTIAAFTSPAAALLSQSPKPRLVVVGCLLVVAAICLFWRDALLAIGRKLRRLDPEKVAEDESFDEREYLAALAMTRQAMFVNRAHSFMASGSPARALVELRKALDENALCRCAVGGPISKEDLLELYRLHLLNSEVPPDFGVLLQLREMLDISAQQAETLERDVMRSGQLFSI